MHILLTSTMMPDAPSGVRVHYQLLAHQLRAQGHHVTLLTPADSPRAVRWLLAGLHRALRLGGALGQQLADAVVSVGHTYFTISRRAHFDVVNAQDVSSGWAAQLALGRQVPVVVTGHFNDHPAEEIVQQCQLRGLAARFVRRWYAFLLKRTPYFVGVSDYVVHSIGPWLPAGSFRTTVHNGIDFNRFASAPASEAADWRHRYPGRHLLVNIGQLEARKNQRYLLDMALALKQQRQDFVLLLAGSGEDETALQDHIRAAGLHDVVVLLGYQPQVVALLQAATLYVHAATRENCPLVLLEAMAANTPVLALAVGGIPELLAATPEALLPAATPAPALAAYLHQLLASVSARRQLQLRQQAAAASFDVPHMLNATLDAYRQIIRQAAGPAASAAALTLPSRELSPFSI